MSAVTRAAPPRITFGPPACYAVVDTLTGRIVATYGLAPRGLRLAHRRADRMDLAYGAVRYSVRRA